MIKQIYKKLLQFNLFADSRTYEEGNIQIVRDQILSTRIFLFLLITILCTLTTFHLIQTNVTYKNIEQPSFITYRHLESVYSEKLSCLCRQPLISYSTFFSVKPTFHEVRISVKVYTNETRILTYII